jgi:predicted O-methyltransferase YrrM
MGAIEQSITADNALQDENELRLYVDLIKDQKVKSYLEVGAKFGGTFRRVASVMPKGSRLVAVDLPGGTRAWKESQQSLKGHVGTLCSQGLDARVIWGDSTDPSVIKEVTDLGPFDLVLIDANHTMPYVRKDWINYGPLGRMVAFHDIAWRRKPGFDGTPIDVPEFWNSIKNEFVYREIKCCPSGKNNGIGVLWRT